MYTVKKPNQAALKICCDNALNILMFDIQVVDSPMTNRPQSRWQL
jgi:hypothetical protein